MSNARLTTVAFAVLGFGLLPTDPARAHTIPAVLELLVETDDRALVQMSHGWLALSGEGLRYVCPARWGGPELPVIAAAEDGAWLATTAGLAKVAMDGAVVRSAVDVGAIQEIGVLGGAVLVLVSGDIGVVADGELSSWDQVSHPISHMAVADDGVWAVTRPNGSFVTQRLDAQGAIVEAHELLLPFPGTPRISVAPDGRAFLKVRAVGRTAIAEIGGGASGVWEEAVVGPVVLEDAVVVLRDGVLETITGTITVDFERRVTCLGQGPDGQVHVCTQDELWMMPATDRTADTPRVRLGEVLAPMVEDLDEASRKACEVEWLDLQVEAGIFMLPAPTPEPEQPSNSGCTATPCRPAQDRATQMLVLCFILWTVHRRRNR